jgi:hypothetical protein
MKTWLSGGKSGQGRDNLFVAVEGGSRQSGEGGRR